MREIYILLENRIKNNEILNQEDIINIINWYLYKYDLVDFLKEINFIDFPNNYNPAWYVERDLKLYINLYNLVDVNIKNYCNYRSKYDMNIVNNCNYLIIMAIFHELKHIEQYRNFIMKTKLDNPFVSSLYSFDKDLKRNRELYGIYHDLFPCEREANVSSCEVGIRCFQNIDKGLLSPNELKVYQLNFIKKLVSDYSGNLKIKSPFMKILDVSHDPLSSKYKEDFKGEYISLYRRLELGLPISKAEYKRIKGLREEVLSDKIKKDENIKKLILKRG